ncbi:MAG: MFS transporter [Methylococcales bacterium]
MPRNHTGPQRRNQRLRQTLIHSQREAVSSSFMTGLCDNFINAFAIHLKATNSQIAWLTAMPQFVGAGSQLFAVWMGSFLPRRKLIAGGALLQAITVLSLTALAWSTPPSAVTLLILLATLYHCAGNLVQPHWRALMGSLVPDRRRGRYFATRTRNSMITAFLVFIAGGLYLDATDAGQAARYGFGVLFLIAAGGRLVSAWQLHQMHDPAPANDAVEERATRRTLGSIRHAFTNATFRHFTLFTAGLQGTVAIAAPFFSVYMLRDLDYSYIEFTANQASSISAQFLTLSAWGRISDRLGNRLIMVVTSLIIPVLPALWLVSDSFWYLLGVQALAGTAWGGFSLSTGNYLYDLRPHHTHLATYSAMQSIMSAAAVFTGAIAGGYLAEVLPASLTWFGGELTWSRSLFGVFAISSIARLSVTLWFIPHMHELRLRRKTTIKSLIFRVARFTPITGVVMDWVGVARSIPRHKGPIDDSAAISAIDSDEKTH